VREIKGANGFVVARVDAEGQVTLGRDAGPISGRVGSKGEIYDDDAGVHQVGYVDGSGTVFDGGHETRGSVDSWGHVFNARGELVGSVTHPADAGVLLLIVDQAAYERTAPAADAGGSLMDEALELAAELQRPGTRKDYKPLSDRDVFLEHLPPQ
jgi:hypothetical protein